MIIQGSNLPLMLYFTEDISAITALEVGLYCREDCSELKHWSLMDVDIMDDGHSIACPLTQQETLHFPAGKCFIETKWLDEDDNTFFAKDMITNVIKKHDKTIMKGAD